MKEFDEKTNFVNKLVQKALKDGAVIQLESLLATIRIERPISVEQVTGFIHNAVDKLKEEIDNV